MAQSTAEFGVDSTIRGYVLSVYFHVMYRVGSLSGNANKNMLTIVSRSPNNAELPATSISNVLHCPFSLYERSILSLRLISTLKLDEVIVV
ncbi:hypothetical protein [Vibrio mediterranei]|nr:hypothetical protein [Vibrio mediterranei]